MIPPLPAAFLETPLAHRALHDIAQGRPENSLSAVRAAIDAGYGIEIDLQPSADGEALVFHDEDMERLTGRSGAINTLSAAQAAALPLLHGDGEGIPTLADVLEIVRGRVPLLIEIKDQDGGLGPKVGDLEQATARALQSYLGPVAVMSFNPHSVAEMARAAPLIPRGLTTCDFDPEDWALSEEVCAPLRAIEDFEQVGAGFISHDATDLARPRVAELRAQGVPVLCWTIRSAKAEKTARKLADNITFEGYLAKLPG